MIAKHPPEQYRSFNFLVELDGVVLGGFSEVSGLGTEALVVDYRDGGGKSPVARRLPQLHKVTCVTLKRGVVDSAAFAQWRAAAAGGRGASIVLYDEVHRPVHRWHVANARIFKFTGPSLAAAGNDVAIESLELVHDGVELEG